MTTIENVAPSITLNTGASMPLMGFGTFQIAEHDQCCECVAAAVRAGYRLVDTAQAYGNEAAVGEGIRQSGIVRDELFVTTKLWFKSYEEKDARAQMEASLERMGVDYFDLALLHWPFGNYYAAWRVLESMCEEGLLRAVGVSNFTPAQLLDLVEFNRIIPAVNQIETHLYAPQRELHGIMNELGIAHQAYAPLGQGRANQMFSEAAVTRIAEKHGKTPQQVALRFLMQSAISVIPRTTSSAHLVENIDVFDFELSSEEMVSIESIDKDEPIIGKPADPSTVRQAMTW